MKRLFLLPALACTVLLLSACPDTKLPTPGPKVPEPKAETTMLYSPPGLARSGLDLGKARASRPS